MENFFAGALFLEEVQNEQEPVSLEEAVIVMEMLQILLKLNRLWSIMTH